MLLEVARGMIYPSLNAEFGPFRSSEGNHSKAFTLTGYLPMDQHGPGAAAAAL